MNHIEIYYVMAIVILFHIILPTFLLIIFLVHGIVGSSCWSDGQYINFTISMHYRGWLILLSMDNIPSNRYQILQILYHVVFRFVILYLHRLFDLEVATSIWNRLILIMFSDYFRKIATNFHTFMNNCNKLFHFYSMYF